MTKVELEQYRQHRASQGRPLAGDGGEYQMPF